MQIKAEVHSPDSAAGKTLVDDPQDIRIWTRLFLSARVYMCITLSLIAFDLALRRELHDACHLKYRRQMSHKGRDLYAHHTCMIAHELCMEALAALTRTCRTWA